MSALLAPGAAGPVLVSAPSLRARVALLVDRFVSWLFAADDAAALELGWTVQQSRFGRTYRAAGFPRPLDALAPVVVSAADVASGGESR